MGRKTADTSWANVELPEEEAALTESEDEVEDDTSDEEIVPMVKTRSRRETFGKKITAAADEEENDELDKTFWAHETWQEEVDDAEWETDNEEKYEDEADSDFGATTGTSDSEDEGREDEGLLDITEEAKKLKKMALSKVYRDPRLTPKKKGKPAKAKPAAKATVKRRRRSSDSSDSDEDFGGSGARRSKGKPARKRALTQAQQLAMFRITEQANLKSLEAIEAQEEIKKQEKAAVTTPWRGPVEIYVTWASDRLIESEEVNTRKIKRSKHHKEQEGVYCREIYFFLDFDNLENSRIPRIYKNPRHRLGDEDVEMLSDCPPTVPDRRCAVSGKIGRYKDPITGNLFHSLEEFKTLRKESMNATETSINKTMASIERRLSETHQVLFGDGDEDIAADGHPVADDEVWQPGDHGETSPTKKEGAGANGEGSGADGDG